MYVYVINSTNETTNNTYKYGYWYTVERFSDVTAFLHKLGGCMTNKTQLSCKLYVENFEENTALI